MLRSVTILNFDLVGREMDVSSVFPPFFYSSNVGIQVEIE